MLDGKVFTDITGFMKICDGKTKIKSNIKMFSNYTKLILPQNLEVYNFCIDETDESERIILYINDGDVDIEYFTQHADKLPAYVEVVYYFDENDMIISYMNSTVKGKKYGTLLLFLSILLGKQVGIKTINLDDCTDCGRSKNNIYIKSGFTYVSDHGPEMIGEVDKIIDNMKSLFK